MAHNRVAFAVIHGMGNQSTTRPAFEHDHVFGGSLFWGKVKVHSVR